MLRDQAFELPVIEANEHVHGAQALSDLVAVDAAGGGWRNRQCLLNIADQVLGGQLAAHCLAAAADGESGLEPNAMHLLFVGAADPRSPYRLEKDALRTGRRMAHRSVRLMQADQVIVQASVILQSVRNEARRAATSFHAEMPEVPPPEACAPRAITPGESDPLNIQMMESYPFLEIRGTEGYVPGDCQIEGTRAFYWVRVADTARLPAIDHYALLTLASDYWYTLPVHGVSVGKRPSYMTTSIDHSIWFHDRPDISEWTLVETQCALIERDIGLKNARYWSRAGRPVATVTQQALIRRSAQS